MKPGAGYELDLREPATINLPSGCKAMALTRQFVGRERIVLAKAGSRLPSGSKRATLGRADELIDRKRPPISQLPAESFTIVEIEPESETSVNEARKLKSREPSSRRRKMHPVPAAMISFPLT